MMGNTMVKYYITRLYEVRWCAYIVIIMGLRSVLEKKNIYKIYNLITVY
jgi:hypothetical protein